MTYEEALQIAMEELYDAVEDLRFNNKGYPKRIGDQCNRLLTARNVLCKALEDAETDRLRAKKKQIYEDLKSEQTHNTKGEVTYDPETGEPLIDGYPLYSGLPKGEEHMINPIKISDFKAILEKLEAEGHTEIAEIILEWEYSCDELPDVDVKDGKVYMYFHDTWTEKKREHDPRNA